MKKSSLMVVIAILIFGLYFPQATTTIINVPTDQPTIQAGINAASDGDTILVEPGIFIENINYNGKNIVIGSLFITTGDTSYITQTVIDGDSVGSVVTFTNNENSTAVLNGFKVLRGFADLSEGGGVYCNNSNPTLKNLKILENVAQVGGGIFCNNSSPIIEDVIVKANFTPLNGGGIYCDNNSNPNLQNVTISDNQSYWYGGGVYCRNSNPNFVNTRISNNTSLNWEGGGIYCNNSNPNLLNVVITRNSAYGNRPNSGGGGIYCVNSNPYLADVTISRNSVKVNGGGIYLNENSTITFDSNKRCNIYLNDAAVGNEIFSDKMLHVVVDTFTVMNPTRDHAFPIENFTFDILNPKVSQDNSTLYISPDGDNANSGLSWDEPVKTISFAKSIIYATSQSPGTIYLAPGVYSPETTGEHFQINWINYVSLIGSGANETIIKGDNEKGILDFTNVSSATIENLTIKNGGYGLGGGIYCNSSSPILKNIIITDCNSKMGGAINSSFGSNPTLINTLIYNNYARDHGGALYGYYSQYNLINVTIANNMTGESGGGIYCQTTRINLVNSVLWDNTPQQVYFDELGGSNSINVAYSNIENGQEGIWDNANGAVNWFEGTNINREPLFTNSSEGDFHLTDESYCIGTGIDSIEINGFWYYSPNEDIEHTQRPLPNNSMPDLGAYEHQLDYPASGLLIANFTADTTFGFSPHIVNFSDLSRSNNPIISWKWDFDEDNITDSEDQSPVWLFENPGFYSISLIVSDGNKADTLIKKDYINVKTKGIIYVSPEGSDENGSGSNEKPFLTIQRGINASMDQDTILVKPGIYAENIDYEGKKITIGSLFLTTLDTSYVSQTIIDGQQNDTVVKFENGEDKSTTLIGFTIQNGGNVFEGGGIYCKNSSPKLKNLKIINNSAQTFGGGIECRSAHPLVQDVIISENNAGYGGGICCVESSNPRLERVLIVKNMATYHGNAICLLATSRPSLVNVTITENVSDNNSVYGFYCEHSHPTILNSILWNNGPKEICIFESVFVNSSVTVAYSDIRGGETGILTNNSGVIYWLDGNINADPIFEDPSTGNFNLLEESPCIDAGSSFFLWEGDTLINLSDTVYNGNAPDMGMFESPYIVGINNKQSVPKQFILYQNYPNPFNPTTIIHYQLSAKSHVQLTIFDITGREVKKLVNQNQNAGQYSVNFNATNLVSGIYLYRLKTESFEQSRKMILLR